jgi:serine/threonine protein kinase
VLKFIRVGEKDVKIRETSLKELNSEFRVGMTIGQDSEFMVHYKEILEYGDYKVIVMEYCEGGDLQKVLDSGKTFSEEVNH